MTAKKDISKSEYLLKNSSMALLTQVLKNVLSFVQRTAFIWVLGKEMLGINSLFTEVLMLLSFAELGIGNAFTYSLYKPLTENDTEHLSSLMRLFSKVYRIVGVIIAVLGLCMMPFLRFLVGDAEIDDALLYEIFLLFVFNSAVSYFFVYKTTLIIADQKNYLVLVVQECVHLIQTVTQIIVLVMFESYVLYMVITVAGTVFTNAFLAHRADKMYPFLREKDVPPLSKKERDELVANVKALIVYKVGSAALGSTNNIFISVLINVATVGLYSNYSLLITFFKSLGTQVVNSVTATVGHVNAEEDTGRKEQMFDGLMCACAWFFGLSSVGLLLLSTSFVQMWAGADYALDVASVAAIVVSFYVSSMHHPCYVYRNTAGLFIYGKFAPIAAAILNIVLDIALGVTLGLPGIFLASIIARLLTYEIVDPFIIYKRVFKKSISVYYLNYLMYAAIVSIAGLACWGVSSFIPTDNWFGFVAACAATCVVYCAVFALLSCKTSGFAVLRDFMGRLLKKRR